VSHQKRSNGLSALGKAAIGMLLPTGCNSPCTCNEVLPIPTRSLHEVGVVPTTAPAGSASIARWRRILFSFQTESAGLDPAQLVPAEPTDHKKQAEGVEREGHDRHDQKLPDR